MEATEVQQTQVETEALQRLAESRGEVVTASLQDYNEDGTLKGSDFVIPEKFAGKSAEEIAKAYVELEKFKAKQAEAPTTTTPVTEEVKEVDEVPKEVKGIVSQVDFDNFSKEYNETGALTEDTYKSLEAKGLSKDIVDNYIAGQKALAETKASKLLEYVGGQDNYNLLIDWAKANYSPEQAQLFDSALFSGDETRVQEQVDLLAFRMSKGGVRRVEGTSTSGSVGMKAFKDKGEWQQATRNPLYSRDAKYTEMVDARYLASKRSGTL